MALEFDNGIRIMVAENPSSLSKIGEVYDRIAFAGCRANSANSTSSEKSACATADVKGYAVQHAKTFARSALANAYSQAMGDVFTRELKPLEVEVIVAEVGDPGPSPGHEKNTIYRVQFDGSISDHRATA